MCSRKKRAVLDPKRMSGSEQAEAAVMSGASRSARQQWCDFIVSALASLAVTLAKLTIALRHGETTSNDG